MARKVVQVITIIQKDPVPNPAPENEATYEKISLENGFTRRDITDEENVDRCILALINEGADIYLRVLLNEQQI